MSIRLSGALLLLTCLLQPAVGSALTLGQIDDFQDGTTQNWNVGAGVIDPLVLPANIPTGGPAGAGDHYLLLTAVGNNSIAGSRLAVINEAQWIGNYLAAGINAISMWVNNLGTTALSLRLVLANFPVEGFPADIMAMSTVPVLLPAGSGWTAVTFPLDPGKLTALAGTVQAALTTPGELRIIHNPIISWPPPKVVASLGVDNITAKRRGPLPLPLLLLDK